jgi:uncharacterized protein (DUF1697 family)
MPRYAALLRGVSPLNAKMAELRRCFEEAGLTDVKTVLGSGNVVFSTRATALPALERRVEKAMSKDLGRTFLTIIRPVDTLEAILASDPFAPFPLRPGAKRVVTFVRDRPQSKLKVPLEVGGARILLIQDREVYTDYVPDPKGAAFMTLIEKTFGKAVTTRTWDTVRKLVR